MVTKYQCTIFSVFPKTANSVWAILQDPSELNNKLPTELDDKSLENVETATEEIQNQLNVDHSIANSCLFPTSLYLHSNSTQILALKKMVFLKKKKSSQIIKKKKLPFFYATFQCGRYSVFKKNLKFFLTPKK